MLVSIIRVDRMYYMLYNFIMRMLFGGFELRLKLFAAAAFVMLMPAFCASCQNMSEKGHFDASYENTEIWAKSDYASNNIITAYHQGPFVGYIKDAETEFIDVYTEENGKYIMSIPYAVFEDFPASDRSSEGYTFGWMLADIYCGNIGDFVWAFVSTGPVMLSSNVNVCVSYDGGKSWSFERRCMRDGSVTGALFISDKVGFITYEDTMYNVPRINRTIDGGKTWEITEVEVPEIFHKDCYFTTLMPVFDGEYIVCPVRVDDENREIFTVNLVSRDGGASWGWEEKELESYLQSHTRISDKRQEQYTSTSVPDPNITVLEFEETNVVASESWSCSVAEKISYNASENYVDVILSVYERELPDNFILQYGNISFMCEKRADLYYITEICAYDNFYLLPVALPFAPLEFDCAASEDSVIVGGTFERGAQELEYHGKTLWYFITDRKLWQMENIPAYDCVKYDFYSDDGKILYTKTNTDYIIAVQALNYMVEAYTHNEQFYFEKGELICNDGIPKCVLGEYYTINDAYLSDDNFLGFDKELISAENVGEFYEKVKELDK